MSEILFAHDTIRPVQQDMMQIVQEALATKKHAIIHAPTGIGKTAAVLFPILTHALEKKLTVFYLTSRHTQHKIVLETLAKMREKSGKNIVVADIIGKKWMCLQGGASTMKSHDFTAFCKGLIEGEACEYYLNSKDKKPSMKSLQLIDDMLQGGNCTSEEIVEICRAANICPYEVSMYLAEQANVIIGDYHYIFNQSIRDMFLSRIKKNLEQCIIIVDEGHNLPARLRELLSETLSTITLNRAAKEARDAHDETTAQLLISIKQAIEDFGRELYNGQEKLLTKNDLMQKIQMVENYDIIEEKLSILANIVRKDKKTSFAGHVLAFLSSWKGEDTGYARVMSKKSVMGSEAVTIQYTCLDPGIASRDIIEASNGVFMISGTLSPVIMYRDLLSFPKDSMTLELPSPFPHSNKLNLIIPRTTTQYKKRDEQQYTDIATICADIISLVPGCVGVFLPSYAILSEISMRLKKTCTKTQFEEQPNMQKNDKEALLEAFKKYKNSGAVLLGVSSASFAEGIDLPGVFKAIIVVGIPLQPPDLETQELIKYYDARFSKGREYGYVWPAFTKTVQSAGRCIRSEHDKGVLVFLDERYAWPSYLSCFPSEWQLKIKKEYKAEIEGFFKNGT